MSFFTVTPEIRITLELMLLVAAGVAALAVAHAPVSVNQAEKARLRVVAGGKVKLG